MTGIFYLMCKMISSAALVMIVVITVIVIKLKVGLILAARAAYPQPRRTSSTARIRGSSVFMIYAFELST